MIIEDARRLYGGVDTTADPRLKFLVANDLAVLAAISGDPGATQSILRELVAADGRCEPARLNAAFLAAEAAFAVPPPLARRPPAVAPSPGDGGSEGDIPRFCRDLGNLEDFQPFREAPCPADVR
jgi:hypothetical protein